MHKIGIIGILLFISTHLAAQEVETKKDMNDSISHKTTNPNFFKSALKFVIGEIGRAHV